MKRICCFCERWESGGIESFLHSVLTQMDCSSLEIDVVAAEIDKSVFTASLEARGIRFVELTGNQRNVFKNHDLFRALLKQRHYDVLHLNAFQGLSLVYLYLAKQACVPVRIAHSHNTALRKSATRPLKQMIHRWAKERFTNHATDLWACSYDAAKFLFSKQGIDHEGYRFIPNGIDVSRFYFDSVVRERVRQALGVTDRFVIGNIGRLCYQKNQTFLIDVFAEVLKSHSQSTLLLVGDGADKELLQQKAERLEIAEQVVFYGTSDCVEQILWAMDAFAFPSHFEGLGIAVVEAQAAGLPVVCSEHVPREARMTEQVRVVPLVDGAQAWAQALCQQKNPDRKGATAAVRNAGFEIRDVAQIVKTRWLGEPDRV